ncbi:zinc-dependent peptidase [Alkalimarinus sediminis]|uniref:Zinc-dependent peptidase n=1 Tax=Alkalimarinus sediminis TaxID=1632866 RepID=A0A9E8HG25_9ALTE|nr:M90 family metallopeptidase [Alkalimarinus sediminis]UZW73562.1 zinc-dependent peptidase [Alkalimarinus sediminis]
MTPGQFLGFVGVVVAVVIAIIKFRRWSFERTPFPPEWISVLSRNIPIYSRLPLALKNQLNRHVKYFLRDKRFYGCDGLVLNDEIRVTIAGQACLLLLNRPTNHYYKLHHILVYPSSFVAARTEQNESGVVSQKHTGLLGESWSQGKVILSWDDVMKGAKNFSDGHNVVLHEFAHQLDQESGSTNGAPLLGAQSSYQSWTRVLSDEFEQLQKQARSGYSSLIDQYGATNPAEFFAVVTETFFERPIQLRRRHPELFEEMKSFYAVDPSEWVE